MPLPIQSVAGRWGHRRGQLEAAAGGRLFSKWPAGFAARQPGGTGCKGTARARCFRNRIAIAAPEIRQNFGAGARKFHAAALQSARRRRAAEPRPGHFCKKPRTRRERQMEGNSRPAIDGSRWPTRWRNRETFPRVYTAMEKRAKRAFLDSSSPRLPTSIARKGAALQSHDGDALSDHSAVLALGVLVFC